MANTENLAIVTGAAGWLGRRLTDVLANGLESKAHRGRFTPRDVRALVLPGEDADGVRKLSDKIQVVVGDIQNPDDCKKLLDGAKGATVFHAAGIIHPKRVSEFRAVNVVGTGNVLDAAIAAGVRRAVIVSSNSPIGVNPSNDHLFDESSPYNPYMGYGRSKMEMELQVKELQKQGRIETTLIRPPWFYGPYQPPRQTLFFEMIRDGKGPVVGGGENRRSMAYIDNLCQGLLLAGEVERANGETYWIADDKPYRMNEVLDTIERLLESEYSIPCAHKRLRLPGLASKIAYLVDFALQSVGLYHQKFHVLSEMNKTIACSVEKAKKELGYAPEVALEEGMRRSLGWCIDQGLLGPRKG
ncbi:MAG: NAD-dependent epimerase/dehydratase family protein [Myxococcales bacterium]|nr:NAD-dependent epimerase/dehydratase family protein [Myxococcales bacterium]